MSYCACFTLLIRKQKTPTLTLQHNSIMKKKTSGEPSHFEFPKSRKEVLNSLNQVLEDKESLYEEYERLQNFTQESIHGDTDNAVNEDNKGKNRLVISLYNYLLDPILLYLITRYSDIVTTPTQPQLNST